MAPKVDKTPVDNMSACNSFKQTKTFTYKGNTVTYTPTGTPDGDAAAIKAALTNPNSTNCYSGIIDTEEIAKSLGKSNPNSAKESIFGTSTDIKSERQTSQDNENIKSERQTSQDKTIDENQNVGQKLDLNT